jgi:fructokinase
LTIAVIGEVLVDLVWRTDADHLTPHPGGSPANVAVGLHRLGRAATLMSTWGDDAPGALVGSHLATTGVPVHRLPSASGRTTVALAYVDADTGSATYDFLTAWDPVALALGPDVTLLHTGSLASVVEPGATRVFEACRQLHGTPGHAVAVDLNVRPAVLADRTAYLAAVTRLAQVTDVLKASDEDLAWLYPDLSPQAAARTLLGLGPSLVVVTQGPSGAFATTADSHVTVPAPAIDVVDTIGAGDSFQASLLDALQGPDGVRIPTAPHELREVLRRCVTAGALACARSGAQPPTRDEIDTVVHVQEQRAALPGRTAPCRP